MVNGGATIAQTIAFEPDTWFAERAQADSLSENNRLVDVQHTAALSDNSIRCCRICGEIITEIVCATENAIICARNCIHERRVIANNGAGKSFDSRYDCDLTAMRLEIAILHKVARANSCAVNHQVEFRMDLFEFFKANIRLDRAACFEKPRGQIIKINRGVH